MTEKLTLPLDARQATTQPERKFPAEERSSSEGELADLTLQPSCDEGPRSRPHSAWAERVSILSSSGKPKRVQEFLVLVNLNAREGYTVTEAARQIGLSVRQLTRLVLGSLGYPPGMIIDLARVCSVAQEILADQTTLKCTAMGHGFPDQATMARQFARFTGVAPGEYRRSGAHSAVSETA